MARAAVFEAVQFGLEAAGTPGTLVKPNRQMLSLSIEPTPSIDVRTFRPRGNKHVTVAVKGKDYTTAKISGPATYTEAIYPFAAILTDPTVGSAGTGGTFTYAPSSTAADSPRAMTVEVGGTGRASRFSYGLVNKFGYTITRASFDFDGTMMGQKYLDDRVRYITASGTVSGGTFTITVGGNTTSGQAFGVAAATLQSQLEGLASVGTGNVTVTALGGALPTGVYSVAFADSIDLTTCTLSSASLTGGGSYTFLRTATGATALALSPIVPEHVSVYIDAASGNIGTTKITNLTEIKVELERYDMFWPIDAAVSSFKEHVETPITGKVSMKGEAAGTFANLMQALRAGATRFVRVQAIDPVAYDTGEYRTFRHDFAIKLASPGDMGDESGVLTTNFEAEIAYDGTWGKATQLYIKNELSAL